MSILNTPRVIAHRGCGNFGVENTLDGIKNAFAAGVRGIEVDVHVSIDGVPFVHHNAALPDRRIIANTHSEEIPKLVPTLLELMRYCTVVNMWIDVDVKFDHRGHEQEMSAHTRAMYVGRTVAQCMLSNSVFRHLCPNMLSSFNKSVLAGAESISQGQLILASIMYKPIGDVPQNIVLPCADPYKWAQSAGRNLWVWGSPTQHEATALFRAGVMGIITNKPELL